MQPRSQGCHLPDSLRSKRFCGVGEQREPEERDFAFCPRERCGERQKEERGGGGGGGRKEPLANKPTVFENLRSPADWLAVAFVSFRGLALCRE